MKYLFILFIFSLAYSQTENVLNSINQNNEQILIDAILQDKFDKDTMDLLLNSIDLKNEIDETVIEDNIYCEFEKNDDKKTKRKVTKTKTVEHNGFELVFLAEARTFRPPAENDVRFVQYDSAVDQLVQAMQASQTRDEMYQILENYINQNGIRDLPLSEQVHFAAIIAEYFPYSDPRSEFKTEFNQGAVDVFQMLTTDNDDLGGICGDIHAGHNDIIKRINPNLEAYTMSYATDNSQHVISYIADPDNPDAIYMTNYSRIEKKGTDGVAALVPTNTSMDDVGERVRFFQYKNGEQDHVGTFRNDIGSLLYELATDPFERSATPNDPRNSVQQIQGRWSKVVNKYKQIEKADGESEVKHKSYVINNDLIMFRGTTNSGNELVGILQKRQKLRNIDANGELRPGEKFGSQGFISTSVSNVDYDRNFQNRGMNWYDETNYFKVYFITGKRYVKRIVEKNGFVFDGFVGHQLEAGVTFDYSPKSFNDLSQGKEFSFNTADGDYSTDIGFKMKYNFNPKNRLYFQNQLTHHIGLNDERSIYSFTTDYPRNLKMTANAFNSNLSLQTDLPNGTMANSINYTGTQMGGKAGYRFDYNSNGGGNLYVSFSTPTRGISSNKVNVLPENYTVFKAGGVTPDLLKKKRVDLRIGGGVELAPTLPSPVMMQGGVKLKF